MKVLLFSLLLLAGSASYADGSNNAITATNQAGASSTLNTYGSSPSPVNGYPLLSGSQTPQLMQALPPPANILYGRLLEFTTDRFGGMRISGKNNVEQFVLPKDNATVTFTSTPWFMKHKNRGGNEQLSADFITRYKGNVNWLGNIVVESQKGKTVLPPIDRQFAWDILSERSGATLKNVIIAAVPRGFNITVGVASEGSAGGISSTIGKLLSTMTVFLGIGPSYMSQSGTAMPEGSWTQQYVVLEEDPNGIPFEIDLVNPREEPKQTQAGPSVEELVAAATARGEAAARDAERQRTQRAVDEARNLAMLQLARDTATLAREADARRLHDEVASQLAARERERAKVVRANAPKPSESAPTVNLCPCAKK